ncbi:hypothetical protein C8F01DRAFT_1062537 [Mycena amicta]|nr:hypothetical protein C8F01DRAFT_1062537 [Mycena amicta]
MAEESSTEHQCLEPDLPESSTAIPVRGDIWMPYGDIILQAESTQFRVNRDVLAQHSPVFSDMFTVPQPADEPTVEGCHIVHLAGDSAYDWISLLDLIYDPYAEGEGLTLYAIEVMLALGQKYEMAKIRQHAIFCIESDFPDTKAAFDLLQSYRSQIPRKICHQAGLAVSVLNLADTYGIKTSMPVLALHCLNLYSMDSLINDKVCRPDGSHIVLHDNLKFMLSVAAERIMQQQEKLFHWLELDNESVIPAEACEADDCDTDRGKIHRVVVRGRKEKRYMLLETWEGLKCRAFVCTPCFEEAKTRWNADRAISWTNLPSFFGLPKWDDLKNDGE